jgi:lambda repressor-like predicted transcriptional regulator
MYYRRQITPEHLRMVLQAHSEGSSLRGISRISGLAYETVVSIIDAASQKAQMIHNQALQSVDSEAIGADEFWSFVEKNKKTAHRALRA